MLDTTHRRDVACSGVSFTISRKRKTIMPSKSKPAKKAAPAKKASKKPAAAAVAQRASILGHSATSVIKWMGKQGFTSEQAQNAIAKLATGEVKPSTVATALSDGKNPKYNGNAATLSAAEIKQLKAAAK
jgi:hypothetical protein